MCPVGSSQEGWEAPMATRRRCRGAPVRMRPLLLPLSSAMCSLLGFWRCSRQGGCWHLHRRGLPVRPKPRPLGVHGVAWMLGGGPGGGRRGVRGRSARLGCGRAAMATWVAWLVMFGEAWWFGRGLTPEYITCPVFSGRRWRRRGRRFLHEGSVVVFSSLHVAPGENLISEIGRWRLSVSCPS